jgi:hypothetical protein
MSTLKAPNGLDKLTQAAPSSGAASAPPVEPRLSERSDVRSHLLLLAACLDFAAAGPEVRSSLEPLTQRGDAGWRPFLAFANHELLAPTLWVRLRDKGLLDAIPASAAAFLRRSHAINTVRNERIRGELLEAARAMNAAGVEPVVLKGGVDLIVSRYGDPGARILRDIDLFVPNDQMDRALAAMERIGYRNLPREATKFVTYYADLTRPGNVVGIDLQWYISGQRDLLTPEESWSDSVPHEIDGVRIRTLAPAHQIVHNLLHSEVQDRGELGLVWLRQLLDLAALWRQLGPSLDWRAVQEQFRARGFPRLVAKRLYLANRLLALPLPDGLEPTLAARLHYRRCLFQLRWRWLEQAMAFRATLASAFDVRMIDVIYDSGTRGWRMALKRAVHGARLVQRHRGQVRAIVRKRLTKFD